MKIDEYAYTTIPGDWKITKLLDDVIMVEFVDGDEDTVNRNGVFVPVDVSRTLWRVGVVLLAGPECKTVKVGDYVMFPNDKGIRGIKIDGENGNKKVVFLNEERIFGICEKK